MQDLLLQVESGKFALIPLTVLSAPVLSDMSPSSSKLPLALLTLRPNLHHPTDHRGLPCLHGLTSPGPETLRLRVPVSCGLRGVWSGGICLGFPAIINDPDLIKDLYNRHPDKPGWTAGGVP